MDALEAGQRTRGPWRAMSLVLVSSVKTKQRPLCSLAHLLKFGLVTRIGKTRYKLSSHLIPLTN
jgi:hypothetical protein